MSTLANITSLNLSLQTGGAALAVKAVKSVAKPARTVYVFGTADDVAPNFTTVDGALTYANSLTPIVTEPVVIRLFTKADGTPYTLVPDEFDEWTVYANMYIYFVSDFVRLNETTTLPTTLPAGQQVWYIDPNGVETLWVGREDGSAWPAVGYKEYVALLSQSGTSAPTVSVLSNTIGAIVWTRFGMGNYSGTLSSAFPLLKVSLSVNTTQVDASIGTEIATIGTSTASVVTVGTFESYGGDSTDSVLLETPISIRVYP
jgi:hypothetical protein